MTGAATLPEWLSPVAASIARASLLIHSKLAILQVVLFASMNCIVKKVTSLALAQGNTRQLANGQIYKYTYKYTYKYKYIYTIYIYYKYIYYNIYIYTLYIYFIHIYIYNIL